MDADHIFCLVVVRYTDLFYPSISLKVISLVLRLSYNWPNSQIPECTCSIFHNAPFRTEICTFLFWMEHCGISWNRCILGFVKLVYCSSKREAVLQTMDEDTMKINQELTTRPKWNKKKLKKKGRHFLEYTIGAHLDILQTLVFLRICCAYSLIEIIFEELANVFIWYGVSLWRDMATFIIEPGWLYGLVTHGLVQKRHESVADALELHLFYLNSLAPGRFQFNFSW